MKTRLFFAACLLLIHAACTSLGIAPADTFEKRVAAGALTVQTVAETTTAAVRAGKLSKGDAENVVTTLRTAHQALMVAQGLYLDACPLRPVVETSAPGCTAPLADNKLTATLTILTALQAYVATQGGK